MKKNFKLVLISIASISQCYPSSDPFGFNLDKPGKSEKLPKLTSDHLSSSKAKPVHAADKSNSTNKNKRQRLSDLEIDQLPIEEKVERSIKFLHVTHEVMKKLRELTNGGDTKNSEVEKEINMLTRKAKKLHRRLINSLPTNDIKKSERTADGEEIIGIGELPQNIIKQLVIREQDLIKKIIGESKLIAGTSYEVLDTSDNIEDYLEDLLDENLEEKEDDEKDEIEKIPGSPRSYTN